jgi:hypothetical protein
MTDNEHALRQAKQARLEAHLRWELVRAALLDQEPELRCHARTLRAYDDLHGRGSLHDSPKPCSRCARSVSSGDGEEGDGFRLVFGYGSRFDLEEWFVVLCDDCCASFAAWVAAEAGVGVQRIGWDGRWRTGGLDREAEAAEDGV